MLTCSALPTERPTAEAAREMPQMMLALGIEPALVQEDHPALFAAMQSVCATCGAKETCDRDLGYGDASNTFTAYCGNASTLGLLKDRPELQRG